MLVPCGTACTLPPVAGLLRSVLVPSGTAPTPTLSVLVPSGTAPPSYARCWFLAEPHPLPSSPPPSYAWCWFLAEPHPPTPPSRTPYQDAASRPPFYAHHNLPGRHGFIPFTNGMVQRANNIRGYWS